MYQYFRFNNYHIVKIPKKEADGNIRFINCGKPITLENQFKKMEVKPTILTNLGFFSLGDGAPSFNFRADGKDIVTNPKYRFGMAIMKSGSLQYGCINNNCVDFVSGYTNLMDNYLPVPVTFAKEIDYKARRTVLAFNDDDVFVVVVENSGADFNDLQNLLGALGVKYAINLDGGGSSNMLIEGKRVCRDDFDRPVPNMLAITL